MPSLILVLAQIIFRTALALPGLSEIRSWYVTSRGYTLLSFVSYPFFFFYYRKTCTRCSVHHQRLLGLPNCLLRLVGQVQHPGLPREARVLGALLLVPGFLVRVPSVDKFFFLIFPLSFKSRYVSCILFIPDAFNSHCRYYVIYLNRAGLCFNLLSIVKMSLCYIHVLLWKTLCMIYLNNLF